VVKVVEKVKVLMEGGRRPSGTRALFSYLFCFCYLLIELDGTDVAKGAVRADVEGADHPALLQPERRRDRVSDSGLL